MPFPLGCRELALLVGKDDRLQKSELSKAHKQEPEHSLNNSGIWDVFSGASFLIGGLLRLNPDTSRGYSQCVLGAMSYGNPSQGMCYSPFSSLPGLPRYFINISLFN